LKLRTLGMASTKVGDILTAIFTLDDAAGSPIQTNAKLPKA